MGATADTKARMVRSAAILLREHGVAGTSVARVLEHSDGPRGSVRHHFPDGKSQLINDALVTVGALVTDILENGRAAGASPATVVDKICEHYTNQLIETDFRAGCPVGTVAQEAFDDPDIGPTVAQVLDDWTAALAALLAEADHDEREALDLAQLCIAAIEGAITLARVRKSARPLELVRERLAPLL